MRHKGNTNPPGRIKIMKALSGLMKTKEFNAITTAEISETAGVTEGLIYKYFKDKKDLLYQVLNEHFVFFQEKIVTRLSEKENCLDRLQVMILTSLESYAANRVLAKILLLEVRNSPAYFESCAYGMVQEYARVLLEIIEQGIEQGHLKPDTDARVLRRLIMGAIEHACLGEIIFGRDVDVKKVSREIANIIFNGVKA